MCISGYKAFPCLRPLGQDSPGKVGNVCLFLFFVIFIIFFLFVLSIFWSVLSIFLQTIICQVVNLFASGLNCQRNCQNKTLMSTSPSSSLSSDFKSSFKFIFIAFWFFILYSFHIFMALVCTCILFLMCHHMWPERFKSVPQNVFLSIRLI